MTALQITQVRRPTCRHSRLKGRPASMEETCVQSSVVLTDMLDMPHLTLMSATFSMFSQAGSQPLRTLELALNNMLKMTFIVVA